MGGLAFREKYGKGSARLSKEDYAVFASLTMDSLRKTLPKDTIINEIVAYKTKPSFGDMDILVSPKSSLDYDGIGVIIGANDKIKNGNVISYAVPLENDDYFQVDIIIVPAKIHDFAYFYFSYNDLGNLLGRLYHRIGFKLGFDGLKYVVRPEDKPNWAFTELTVSTDIYEVLRFGGYDPSRWTKGFETLEDVYKYVYGNGLVYRDMYLLENRNHISRIRDRKRKTYTIFLQWLEKQRQYPYLNIDKKLLRQIMLDRAFIMFPDFYVRFEETVEQMLEQMYVKTKFNGDLVREWTGLENKQLGMFMSYYKETTNRTFLRDSTVEQIKEDVIDKFTKNRDNCI